MRRDVIALVAATALLACGAAAGIVHALSPIPPPPPPAEAEAEAEDPGPAEEPKARIRTADVEVGAVYAVKVSGKIVAVRVIAEAEGGGWIGTSRLTGRNVWIKSAQRLRYRIKED